MAARLRFEVLGPLRVWRGGVEVGLGSRYQRAVLAALLLRAGTPVSVEDVVAAVWGVTAPAAAPAMVRSYVSRLRRTLAPDHTASVIRSLPGGYALHPDETDVADFERHLDAARHAHDPAIAVRAALALWRGTPWVELTGEHVDLARVRLAGLHRTAIDALTETDRSAATLLPIRG